MAETIRMPADGMILNWLKNPGDAVTAGEVVVEVEADKATMEVEAPADGLLLDQLAAIGDEVVEGTVLGNIGTGGEVVGAAEKPARQEAVASAAPAATPAPAPASTPAPATNGHSRMPGGRIKASPLARRMADERGIDIALVQGTGPGGRITRSDVEGFTPGAVPAVPAAPPETPAAAPSAAPGIAGAATWGALPTGEDVEIIEIGRMRQRIASSTILSKQQVPHFYVTAEVDVEAMLKLRAELNATLEASGIKITVNDMIVKATALTLRQFPNLNSHYYGDKIVRHKRIHIGMAVALPDNGLINVVAHDADALSLSKLAENNKAVVQRARDGKIKPADVQGSTFTTSNLGAYDVESFAAIISTPEAGILAVGAARKVPVVREDGTLGVSTRMKVTIAVDHRVSDGAEGAQFLQAFKLLVENPMRLLV